MVNRVSVRRVWATVALAALALVSPAVMANFAYTANPTTGGTASPSVAGSIYWMDWSGISLPASGSSQNASFTLADGSVLSLTITRGGTTPATFAPTPPPSWSGAAIGNVGYCFPTCGSQTGAPNVVLYTTSSMGTTGGNPNTLSFTLSDITLTNPAGNPVANYQVVMADGESTDTGDASGANWTYTTTGGNWAQVDYVASTSGGNNGATLTLSGQTAVQSATTSGNGPSWIVATASPGTVSGNSNFQITATTTSQSKQGILLGIRLGQVNLTKNITARANPADQFTYNIINAAGTSVGQGTGSCAAVGPCTTTGATTGNQTTISASVAPGNTVKLSETMASGSASSLGAYTSTIACTNSNSGSSTVLPNGTYNPSSPPTITLQSQSDRINCTITNNAATLSVAKSAPTIANVSGNTYTAKYTVTVANTGTVAGTYTLQDTPGFPIGVTLNSWTVTTTGGTVNSPLPAVANNTAAQISASNVSIAKSATHTYTVTINFTTSSSVPASSLTCSATGIAGSGAFNAATVTSGGNSTSAYGCGTLPGTTAIVVSKGTPAITATGTNTYSAVYAVKVLNTGNATGQYTLTDTPGFPSGVTFNSWTVTTTGGTVNGSLAAAPTNNSASRISGNNVSIVAGATHTYMVTINYTMSPSVPAPSLVCSGSAGSGAYNAVTATPSTGTAATANGCGTLTGVPSLTVAKGAPTITNTGGNTYSATYTLTVSNTGGAAGSYTLTDTPGFPATGVTLTNWTVTTTNGTLNSPVPAVANNTAAQISASNVSIAAGTTSVPTTHTYTVQINYTMTSAASALTCSGSAGSGAYNATAITGSSSATANNCGALNKIVAVTINKTVTGAPAAGAPGGYAFSLVCNNGTYTGTVALTGTATNGSTTVDVPQGAICSTLTETSKATAPTNYNWGTETTVPPGTITTGSSGSITNPLSLIPGTLTVTKTITGGPAVTSAMAFPFNVACSTPAATYPGTVNVAANATTGSTTVSIPAGSTNCTIAEGARPTAPTNYTWGAPTYTQPSAAAMPAGGTASGTIVNPLTRNQIAVTISKTVTGAPASGAPGAYGFSLTCDTGTYTGTVTLTGTATTGSTTVNVPQGATCPTLTETSKATAPTNYTWGTATTTAPVGTIAAGSSGSMTNPLTRNQIAVTISKTVTGAPASGAPGAYGFSLTCDTGTYTGTVTLAGTATTGSTTVNVPQGATCPTLTETSKAAAPTGYSWGTATTVPPTGTIAAGSSGTITNPLNLPADITVTKTVKTVNGAPATTSTVVSAGDTIVYTLTYKNSGGTAGVGTAYEVVPQHTQLTAIDTTAGSTACGLAAPAGTACRIDTVSPIAANNGTASVDVTVVVASPLASGTTSIFNLASTTLPPSCTANGICTTPPSGPSCTAPDSCTNNPVTQPAVTVVKSVDASTPNPIGANQDAVFDLTVTNTVTGTTQAAGYSFYEVVPQNTTFTALTNGTTDCALPAAAGTLCTIVVTNPVVAGAPQVLKATFHTVSPLAAGTTSIFNVATQTTTSPPPGCTSSTTVCTSPPTTCPATNATCARVPTGPNLFDPPFISKAVKAVDLQTLNWTVVVDNNRNAVAQYTEIRDPLPAGLTFVSGSVTCQTFGASTVSSCAFDQINNRVVADALLASDLGVASPATAPNRLVIVFTAKYTTTPAPVTNVALACYDSANSPGATSACAQSVSGTATYTPPSQPAQQVPLDARWMLGLMALLLGAGAAGALRKRAAVHGR
ncbi:MAG: hypothetical protein JSS16_05255 [Proteobacteria bacterium]|nr:hypothetical protein [Pseudomonadota bacterium]